ncbi:hypothetical protein PoB_005773300 [Plakobranchus ocellatus]|uniref:Uncharacterized protein n=1 Tax=Plakobranchus ocellatus TaxID=259542 RepID=A0AAV4CJG9_9GAST|nr:hypothetical protein PoB_005773300 [Plakobranchus ocellatus]
MATIWKISFLVIGVLLGAAFSYNLPRTRCYYGKRCYQVGSEVVRHNVNNCHYLKCTVHNGIIKFRQFPWGCTRNIIAIQLDPLW